MLFTEGIKLFSLISGTTAAIILLVFILGKWNSTLDNEVKRRTHELNESNNKLNVANEELKKHERAQKDFINMAAHELRNPIQPLLSTCYLLRSGTGDSNKNNDLLDIAIRSIERLQRLAEDILDVTRIESNTLKIRKERFNLDELITNIIEEYRKNIQETKEIKLNYHSKNKGLVVNGDKTRLGQVLSNLLSNSLKFTKQGSISVDTEIKDGYVVVTVSDTGTGIDKEILPKLFSKFSTRSITGTGLGLFISKSIVEAHGGKIWAEKNCSKEPGATFRFTLPISERYESDENTKEE